MAVLSAAVLPAAVLPMVLGVALGAFAWLVPASASAFGGGIGTASFPTAQGCGSGAAEGCHAANSPQASAFLTFLDTPVRGQSGQIRVTVSGSGTAGGYNLGMGSGTLAAGTGSRLSGAEVTHSARLAEVGGNAVWVVNWTPSVAGSVSYTLWANSVDANGGTTGDFPRTSAVSNNVTVLRPQGDSCSVNGDCANGTCRDGRCCNNTCTGACRACSTAAGGTTNGVCTDISGEDCVGVATCVDAGSPLFFACSCPSPQYSGTGRLSSGGCVDVDECASNPCAVGGDHDDNSGQDGQGCDETAISPWSSPGYTCSCEAGYEQGGSPRRCVVGNECTSGADDCDNDPAAVCFDPNPSNGSLNDFTCTCPAPAWTNDPTLDGHGAGGCNDVNECLAGIDNCHADAFCTNTTGGFTCTCNPGYAGNGVMCLDIDECMAGTDNCSADATCTNSIGSFSCACNAGYEDNLGTSGGVDCVNIDECARGTDDCDVNATCEDTAGSFNCTCNSPAWQDAGGTNGRSCIDVDECTLTEFTSLCSTASTCFNSIGSWECTCNMGYRGDGFDCENIDECAEATDSCHADATCADTIGSYTCACNTGYVGSGFACADIDECASGTHGCGVNEVCVNNVGTPNDCVCAPGYTLDVATDVCRVVCGDGAVGPGEACDDGNVAATDGCSDLCAIEPGWACIEPTGAESLCTETCGDGLIDATEECDDAEGNSDTGVDACRTTCVLAACGDGTTDTGEACDDGAANDDTAVDGCRTTCDLPYCGDGVVDTGESCDTGGGLPGAALAGQCTTLCFPDAGIDPEDPPSLTGGACSCRAVPTGSPTPWLLLGIALVGVVLRRRR